MKNYRKKKQKKKSSRNSGDSSTPKFIVSAVLAFVLSILLTLGTCLLAGYFGFMRPQQMINCLEESGYYTQVLTSFTNSATDEALPFGVPIESVNDIVSEDQIKMDVDGYLLSQMGGDTYKIDTSELESKLVENAKKVFSAEGTSLNEEQLASLEGFSTTIGKIYAENMKFPMAGYVGSIAKTYQKLVIYGLPVCLILALAAVWLLLSMRHWKHRGLRFVVYSTIAATIMTAVAPAGVLVSKMYSRLNIKPQYLYDFIQVYVKKGLITFIIFAVIWIIVSILFMIIIKIMRGRLSKNKK